MGYGINRAAPLIGGIDWRLGNGIVTGVAATYVASSASFKDGSRTNLSSYQGAIYAGWSGGPWYALGSAVVSFNDFGTSRLLTPFGLPGDAGSKPSGESYQGHAEAGYHWGLPAGGTNVSLTPYAALDYVNAHIGAFNETGGFGAFSVNAADSNSFQTTLGVRLTSRIAMGNYGTLIPELRVGWNHEFLDTSQTIVTTLIGVPGSLTSTTGIKFGRDAALIGRRRQHGAFARRQGLRRLRRQARLALAGALDLGRREGEVLRERALLLPPSASPFAGEGAEPLRGGDEGVRAFGHAKNLQVHAIVDRCRHSPSSAHRFAAGTFSR